MRVSERERGEVCEREKQERQRGMATVCIVTQDQVIMVKFALTENKVTRQFAR